jgi:hypothetical protein
MRTLTDRGSRTHQNWSGQPNAPIAPPDMNSYIKKYEFKSTVTCEFVHMNSYVSDPCLVYKKWPLTDEVGGGWTDHTPYWSLVQIPKTWIHFVLANLANFYVAAILEISTYIKPNIWFQNGDIASPKPNTHYYYCGTHFLTNLQCGTTQQTTSSTQTKKTPTPWFPPAVGFQRLQINRWVWLPDVARWRTISATRRCNFLQWN